MTRTLSVWLLLGFMIVALVGCRPNQQLPTGQMHTIIDSQGISVTLSKRPQRIVSVSIAADEMLINIVTPNRIAGLTHLADDPGISNIVDAATQVKARVSANVESIVALQPDLVIIPNWQSKELIQMLREVGLPVYVFDSAKTIEQIKDNIKTIATLTGELEAGESLITAMNTKLALVSGAIKDISERKVVVRMSLMGGIGGIGSTFDDVCRYAGVINGCAVAGLSAHAVLAKEQLIAVNPDLLILPTWNYNKTVNFDRQEQELLADESLQTLRAIRNKQLVRIPDRYLYCTSQYIVQGIYDLAAAAYPQALPPTAQP